MPDRKVLWRRWKDRHLVHLAGPAGQAEPCTRAASRNYGVAAFEMPPRPQNRSIKAGTASPVHARKRILRTLPERRAAGTRRAPRPETRCLELLQSRANWVSCRGVVVLQC